MTLILPMRCKSCDWPCNVRSDGGMPRCACCHGKLSPDGPVRTLRPDEDNEEPPRPSDLDDILTFRYGWGDD